MGIKDSIQGASTIIKVALACLFVADFLNWIAFTTTSWAEFDNNAGFYGIWRFCTTATCTQLDGVHRDWYNAFQAFAIFGFILINVSFALAIFFVFVNQCKADKEVGLAAAITGIAAAVMWLIAVIIFGAEYEELTIGGIELGFSFALAIIAFIFSAVGGVAMLVGGGGVSTKPSG